MERKKYILIICCLTLGFQSLTASYHTDIYKAYIMGDMEQWKKVIDTMDAHKSTDGEFIAELINFQYGYIGWCIGNKKNKIATGYLEKAEKNLSILEKEKKNESLVNAYRSAFYGFRIGMSPLKAPVLGPKSMECAKKAIRLDEKNPLGFIQLGNCYNYMPVIFGGSKTIALDHYKKAEKLMEEDSRQLSGNWNYLSLLTIIGQACQESGDLTRAKYYYDKALHTEPEFVWVKSELLPALAKKTKTDE